MTASSDPSSGRHPLASLALGALVGWLALVGAWAVNIFVLPHGPNFAPEVGPVGVFVIFGAVYSLFYALDFLVLTMPCYLIFRDRIRPGLLLRCIFGAVVFCLSVPIWELFVQGSWDETFFLMPFAAAAGAGAFAVLKPSPATTRAA